IPRKKDISHIVIRLTRKEKGKNENKYKFCIKCVLLQKIKYIKEKKRKDKKVRESVQYSSKDAVAI
ncbi:MAG: hypothetical protein ACLRZ7_07240, partial [Lachnospiraceae bacterium]